MNQKRNRGHLELTGTEHMVLAMRRSGMKLKDISAELGMRQAGNLLAIAAEKERILAIEEKESRKGGVTSLARARGRNEHGV